MAGQLRSLAAETETPAGSSESASRTAAGPSCTLPSSPSPAAFLQVLTIPCSQVAPGLPHPISSSRHGAGFSLACRIRNSPPKVLNQNCETLTIP